MIRTSAIETAIIAASQIVAVAAEVREVYTLLVVEAARKPICQMEHSAVAFWAVHSKQIDTTSVERSRVQWKPCTSFRHGVP
jgi:hypothetical protein